jgi:hypothetical protein
MFKRELKEAGVLMIKWILGAVNEADIFAKNLDGPTVYSPAMHQGLHRRN